MADWKYNAIQDLREYRPLQESLTNIPQEIAAIDLDMQMVKGVSFDKIPVEGGASRHEDRLISGIDRKQRLSENLNVAKMRVERIERGLRVLSDTEQLILRRFYIQREGRYVERLCEELGYEERNIYKIKDSALKKFALSMFGIVDF